ncbi:MAG: hypothetical protein AB7K09_05715 [Planctomycetota bacterium]
MIRDGLQADAMPIKHIPDFHLLRCLVTGLWGIKVGVLRPAAAR